MDLESLNANRQLTALFPRNLASWVVVSSVPAASWLVGLSPLAPIQSHLTALELKCLASFFRHFVVWGSINQDMICNPQ